MVNQDKLNEKILSTILKIQENFPELITHLNETPISFEFNAEDAVSIKALKDYSDSLCQLLDTYTREGKNI